jgi:dTDP-glucose 4,6-dehydratase
MLRCLITGGQGFIGRHLVRHVLETTDWSVVSIDRLDEAANHEALTALKQRYPGRLTIAYRDLRAPVVLASGDPLVGSFDYVAHLAAASHVTRSIADPMGFVHDNVLGTAHLLEWARTRQHRLRKFLIFSTDEVFGPADDGGAFDESSRFEAHNPYAASKAAAEALGPAWANTFGLPIVVTRCTNVYGPGQHPEKFIPMVVDMVCRGEVVQIHARGGQPSSRYYVHVDDVCRAALMVLERGGVWSGAGTGKYNISGAEELSNLDVAQAIAKTLGLQLRYELCEAPTNRPRHDQRYAIAGARLNALGWRPEIRFADGLPAVVASFTGERAA